MGARVSTAPPGWYPSPDSDGVHRWWDGARWTDHVRHDVPQPVPGEPTARVLDVSHVEPYNRQAAEMWHAMKERGGLAGTIGGAMSAALGAQEVAAPQPVARYEPAAQYPPAQRPAHQQAAQYPPVPYGSVPITDAPGVPLVMLGDLGFARTHDPALQNLQVGLGGDDDDDDLDISPFGAIKAIGFGAVVGVFGLVLLFVGPPVVAVVLQLVGLVFVGIGVRVLYVTSRDLHRGARELGAVGRALSGARSTRRGGGTNA